MVITGRARYDWMVNDVSFMMLLRKLSELRHSKCVSRFVKPSNDEGLASGIVAYVGFASGCDEIYHHIVHLEKL